MGDGGKRWGVGVCASCVRLLLPTTQWCDVSVFSLAFSEPELTVQSAVCGCGWLHVRFIIITNVLLNQLRVAWVCAPTVP